MKTRFTNLIEAFVEVKDIPIKFGGIQTPQQSEFTPVGQAGPGMTPGTTPTPFGPMLGGIQKQPKPETKTSPLEPPPEADRPVKQTPPQPAASGQKRPKPEGVSQQDWDNLDPKYQDEYIERERKYKEKSKEATAPSRADITPEGDEVRRQERVRTGGGDGRVVQPNEVVDPMPSGLSPSEQAAWLKARNGPLSVVGGGGGDWARNNQPKSPEEWEELYRRRARLARAKADWYAAEFEADRAKQGQPVAGGGGAAGGGFGAGGVSENYTLRFKPNTLKSLLEMDSYGTEPFLPPEAVDNIVGVVKTGAKKAADIGKKVVDVGKKAAYLAATTPPSVVAASGAGRLSGLGYDKTTQTEYVKHYKNLLNYALGMGGIAGGALASATLGKIPAARILSAIPGINTLSRLSGLVGGAQLASGLLGGAGAALGAYKDAATTEAANLATAAFYDPRALARPVQFTTRPVKSDQSGQQS